MMQDVPCGIQSLREISHKAWNTMIPLMSPTGITDYFGAAERSCVAACVQNTLQ